MPDKYAVILKAANETDISTDGSGAIVTEYLYRGRIRLAMADRATGAVYTFHNNELGTPELMTDSTNTVVWEGISRPFGETAVNSGSTVVNNFRFQGQYYDAETGLHYNGQRYYDPKTGRYLSPDPIGLAGGVNPYVYVGNDPVNLIDLLGLAPGDPYSSPNAAAFAARSDILSQVDRQTLIVEYGGWIYQQSDRSYSYTAPRTDYYRDQVWPGPRPTGAVADYHRHVDDPGYRHRNEFSPEDNDTNRVFGVQSYLFRPDRRVDLYDPASNSVYPIYPCAN